jgi:hypothetical protein
VTTTLVTLKPAFESQPDGTWLASCVSPALFVAAPTRELAETGLRRLAAEYLAVLESLPAAERDEWVADLRARGADCCDVPATSDYPAVALTFVA